MTYPQNGYGQQNSPGPAPMQLIDASPGGGGNAPLMRHLVGRTVVMVTTGIDEHAQGMGGEAGKPKPQATFDLYVIDGGPITYGDAQASTNGPARPPQWTCEVPAFFPGAQTNNDAVVKELRSKWGQGAILGVIEVGTRAPKGNPPFLVGRVDVDLNGQPRPDAQQRRDAAGAFLSRIQLNPDSNPRPVAINQGPQQGGYGQPQQGPGPQVGPGVQQGQPGADAPPPGTNIPQQVWSVMSAEDKGKVWAAHAQRSQAGPAQGQGPGY